MSRTSVDIDDDARAEVMRRYRLATKREVINYAPRTLAAEPLGVDDARRLRQAGQRKRPSARQVTASPELAMAAGGGEG